MRFIYLSTTKEKGDFETIEKAVKYFEAFISEPEKDFNFKSKISRKNFSLHEDIFFLKTAKRNDKNTYIVVAYGRSSTTVLAQTKTGYENYPYYFRLEPKCMKIFPDGIDIEYFNSFIYENKIRGIIKPDFFTSNISHGRYIGSPAWRYFKGEDAERIMVWFKDFLFDNTAYFVNEQKKFCNQINNLFCGAV